MKKIAAFFVFFCVVVFFGMITASADSIASPEPYSIPLEGGNKILCITPTDRELHGKNKSYPKSGLYYNENPPRNIYYFDDYLHEYNSYLHESCFVYSNDGMAVALIPWAQNRSWHHQSRQFEGPAEGEAILFFKNGAFLKSYTVGELIRDGTKAKFSVSHVEWENTQERKFDPETNVLSVTAKDGTRTNLDLNTGSVLFSSATGDPWTGFSDRNYTTTGPLNSNYADEPSSDNPSTNALSEGNSINKTNNRNTVIHVVIGAAGLLLLSILLGLIAKRKKK